MTVELTSLSDLALTAARQAAALIRDHRRAGRVAVTATKSSPTDAVTAVDTAAERLIRDVIAAARPRDGFFGEEGGSEPGSSGVRWVLDPIDGTVNFVYGIPAYAVSVGVEVEGRCRAGVVIDVVSGAEFSAAAEAGAWFRSTADAPAEVLLVPEPPPLSQCLVATGFGYDVESRTHQAMAVARLLPMVRDIRRIGAASLDLCNVAAGRVDAYVEQGLQPWDLAAGGLIAREAGAAVTGAGGGEPSERLVVSCAPALLETFQGAVTECGF